MSKLSDFYSNQIHTPLGMFVNAWLGGYSDPFDQYYQAYNESHGSDRYVLSQLPGYGKLKNFQDEMRRAQDQYDSTGRDYRYSGDYGHGGIPGLSDISNAVSPVRMASKLSRMYGAEVTLDIVNARRSAYRLSSQAANDWYRYESLRQQRR